MSTVTVRTDPEVDAALRALTADGTSRSEAVRAAILDAARARLRAEVEYEARQLAADADDVVEARAVQADLTLHLVLGL